MAVAESDDVGLKIANALGINLPNIRRVDLKLEAGNIVEVNVAYYPTKEAMEELLIEMKSYELVKKEKKQKDPSAPPRNNGTPVG